MFLVNVGASKTKAREKVAAALHTWGIEKSAAEGLRSLETRYRKTCSPKKLAELQDPEKLQKAGLDPAKIVSTTGRADAFILPEKLPRLWLEQLGRLFLHWEKQVNSPNFITVLSQENLKDEWAKAKEKFLSSGERPAR
jgi:hypothetical protein